MMVVWRSACACAGAADDDDDEAGATAALRVAVDIRAEGGEVESHTAAVRRRARESQWGL